MFRVSSMADIQGEPICINDLDNASRFQKHQPQFRRHRTRRSKKSDSRPTFSRDDCNPTVARSDYSSEIYGICDSFLGASPSQWCLPKTFESIDTGLSFATSWLLSAVEDEKSSMRAWPENQNQPLNESRENAFGAESDTGEEGGHDIDAQSVCDLEGNESGNHSISPSCAAESYASRKHDHGGNHKQSADRLTNRICDRLGKHGSRLEIVAGLDRCSSFRRKTLDDRIACCDKVSHFRRPTAAHTRDKRHSVSNEQSTAASPEKAKTVTVELRAPSKCSSEKEKPESILTPFSISSMDSLQRVTQNACSASAPKARPTKTRRARASALLFMAAFATGA